MWPAALLLAGAILGQNTAGELRLAVQDAAGAAIAAHVELVCEAAEIRDSVTLASDGRYTFVALPFGSYRLTVSHSGFTAATLALEIRTNVPQSRDVTLTVQPVETMVNVRESATLVDTRAANSTYHVGSDELTQGAEGIPGRGLIDLIAMQPGWTLEANGVLHPRESEYEVQYVVGGFPVYDNRSPAFAAGVDSDDAESLKVYAGGIPAEFGQRLGGVVEANTRRTTASLSGETFVTDRYLEPPTLENSSNHASHTGFTGAIDRDSNRNDRLRFSFGQQRTWFLVPNDLLQQAAGQHQDRTSGESEGRVTWQHVFSSSLVGFAGAQVRDVSARLWSNPLSTPIPVAQDRGFRECYFKVSLAGHHGRHDWKTGAEARYASLGEEFDFNIVTYSLDPGGVTVAVHRAGIATRPQNLRRLAAHRQVDRCVHIGRRTLRKGLPEAHRGRGRAQNGGIQRQNLACLSGIRGRYLLAVLMHHRRDAANRDHLPTHRWDQADQDAHITSTVYRLDSAVIRRRWFQESVRMDSCAVFPRSSVC